MTKRFYIVPVVGTGTAEDSYRPKYFGDLSVSWNAMPFGKEPYHLVVADLTTDQHTVVAAYSDVIVIPANIDNTVRANKTAVVNALELLNIPAGWVTTGMTYRKVLKTVAAIFQFAQRLHGHANLRIYESNVTMSTKFNQLPSNVRTKLIETAQTLNFDTSSLARTSTIRQILKAMVDQWGDREIHIGGFVL